MHPKKISWTNSVIAKSHPFFSPLVVLNDLNENADDPSEKELYNYPSTPSTPGKSASFYSLANELLTFQNHGTREVFTIHFPTRKPLLSCEEPFTFP